MKNDPFIILSDIHSKIEEFENLWNDLADKIKKSSNDLLQICNSIDSSFSGSWMGYHAKLYFQGFQRPPHQYQFDSSSVGYFGIPRGWQEVDYTEMNEYIDSLSPSGNLKSNLQDADSLRKSSDDFKNYVITYLSWIRKKPKFKDEVKLLIEIEKLNVNVNDQELLKLLAPRQHMSTDMQAVTQGIKTPPHINYQVNVMHCLMVVSKAEDLLKKVKRLYAQIHLSFDIIESDSSVEVISSITRICSNFHFVARQLQSRRENRPTIELNDEYDVQDLFHSLLRLYFTDIRAEEWTPSYAGKSARSDFLIKQQRVIIEIKKTRKGLTAKEVGDQLIIDIARYQSHPDCGTLICFVYDPEARIANPAGIERDLSRKVDNFNAIVIIEPK